MDSQNDGFQQNQQFRTQDQRTNDLKQNIPKLKFAIQGMNYELPQSLSQRRNSAMQQLFMTTTSISSTLQSARGFNSTQTVDNIFQTQVNLESTQELKAFATVDLVKINKDRQNQLKLALEDNLKEKERELNDAEISYQQQKEEYDKVSLKQLEKSNQLENEVKKQREYINNLKDQIREMEEEYKEKQSEFMEYMSLNEQTLGELQQQIEVDQKAMSQLESDLQVLQVQKKGLQMGIEMQKKVKLQELDMKIQPLIEEKEKMALNLEMLENNLKVLKDIKSQNENEQMMIEEDLLLSEQIKVDLVFQREDLEEMIERTKESNSDLGFISPFIQSSQPLTQQLWDQIINELVFEKQKALLLDLIRELQQYILGMSSNTTDNSVLQSDELEDLQFLIENQQIQLPQAVEAIAEFAQRKIQLNLSNETLNEKLDSVYDQIDPQQLHGAIKEIQQIEQKMKDLDARIKVVNNRCQNELKPREKALIQSEQNFSGEIDKATSTIQEVRDYSNELEQEISSIQLNFENTYSSKQEDIIEIEDKLAQITGDIQQIEYQLDKIKGDLQQNELTKLNTMNDKSVRATDFESFKQSFDFEYSQIKDEYKRERQKQQDNFVNPVIEELSKEVAQLKCDKESSFKRLKYIETKLQNSRDSVQHAKQVLENHILQAQQEQLNSKINSGYGAGQKRMASLGGGATSNTQQNQRLSQVQTKANSLYHGEILSPSKDINIRRNSNSVLALEKQQIAQGCDTDRMHNHYIDQSQRTQQPIAKDKSSFTSAQKMRKNLSNVTAPTIYNEPQQQQHQFNNVHPQQNDKSTIDVCKYYYDSQSVVSSSEAGDTSSNLSQHFQNFNNQNPQKHLPIQSLITPRDVLQEMQENSEIQRKNYIHESGNQYSMASHNDSICSSASKFDKNNISSVQNQTMDFNNQSTLARLASNSNHLMRNQKVSLRQANSSYDGKQIKNVVVPLYATFKENIMPNQTQNTTITSFSMRKLSQASNLSQISSNQSILNSLQTGGGHRPPAVPQSKNSSQYLTETPRGSSQKGKRNSMNQHSQSRNTNIKDGPFSTQQPKQTVQTKMRLNMNSNNGRVLQIGIVDLSKCNQTSKDIQFFESIKPLIEGASFLVLQDSQYVLKQIYLDLSLLRLYLSNFNGDKEILMLDSLIKPELPQNTLDQIRNEKNSSFNSSQSKKYEFNLILNMGGIVERMSVLSTNYDELKQWIIGLNALISNKSNLMRLSSLITTN